MEMLAVLIDADNASIRYIEPIFEEIAKYGIASVKRIYGDWSVESLKNWKEILLPLAITPIQQFSYITGKDATDMILIIDAMDLLYAGNLDGFCIISSDSDFTPLASRIRQNGLKVYGFGKKNTNHAFRNACDKFIYVENLLPEAATCPSPEHTTSSPPITSEKAEADAGVAIDTQTLNLLYRAVKDNADENGWAYLGSIGQYLNNVKPDFDTRNYGRAKLSGFIKTLAVFETKLEGSQMFVRKFNYSKLIQLIHTQSKPHEGKWLIISQLANNIKLSKDHNFEPITVEELIKRILSIHDKWVEFSPDKTQLKLKSV